MAKVATVLLTLCLAGLMAGCGGLVVETVVPTTPTVEDMWTLTATSSTPAPETESTASMSIATTPTRQTLTSTPAPIPTPTETSIASSEAHPTTPTFRPTELANTVTVDVPTLNVRQGPGISFAILAQVHAGEVYPIVGRTPSGRWLEIVYEDGRGWIFGQHGEIGNGLQGVPVTGADPTATPTASPSATSTPTPTYTPTDSSWVVYTRTPIAPEAIVPIAPPPLLLSPTAIPDKVVFTGDEGRVTDPIDMQLVRVPEGEFLMGSAPADDSRANEAQQPQHAVSLDEFYIGKHEVTNDQYAAFVEAIGHDAPNHWEGNSVPAGKEDHPVVHVSWNDAMAFAQWLSEETGTEFWLCTEAEWEKACRGTTGLIYPWGNMWDASKANTGDWGIGTTTQVGSYSPIGDSPYGATDMCGNAWEWVADWYSDDYYQRSPTDNPQEPDSGDYRVLRGGSFSSMAGARCADRVSGKPDSRVAYFGFRVCASPG